MFAWRDADGVVDLAHWGGANFPTQADAEVWLTETYTELVDAGVAAVSLYRDDHQVYGPMSLSG